MADTSILFSAPATLFFFNLSFLILNLGSTGCGATYAAGWSVSKSRSSFGSVDFSGDTKYCWFCEAFYAEPARPYEGAAGL